MAIGVTALFDSYLLFLQQCLELIDSQEKKTSLLFDELSGTFNTTLNKLGADIFQWWRDIPKFCSCHIDQASPDTQKAWTKFFCTFMLPPMNDKLRNKKSLFLTRTLSDFISPCDKAFAIYLVKYNCNQWLIYWKQNLEKSYGSKKVKEHAKQTNSKLIVSDLARLTNVIHKRRRGEDTGKS